jgi:hypothetical protein
LAAETHYCVLSSGVPLIDQTSNNVATGLKLIESNYSGQNMQRDGIENQL